MLEKALAKCQAFLAVTVIETRTVIREPME